MRSLRVVERNEFGRGTSASVVEIPGGPIVFEDATTIPDRLVDRDAKQLPQTTILDFRNVVVIGSTQLFSLIEFTVRMRRLEKRVQLVNVGPRLLEVFEITRFTRLAEIQPSENGVVAASLR